MNSGCQSNKKNNERFRICIIYLQLVVVNTGTVELQYLALYSYFSPTYPCIFYIRTVQRKRSIPEYLFVGKNNGCTCTCDYFTLWYLYILYVQRKRLIQVSSSRKKKQVYHYSITKKSKAKSPFTASKGEYESRNREQKQNLLIKNSDICFS